MSRQADSEPFVIAECAEALRRQLEPYRGRLSRNKNQGRDNALIERGEFARWMPASSAASGLLEFPCTIWHRDKPDFLMKTPVMTIGVEVCGVVSQVVSRARYIAAKNNLIVYREPKLTEIGPRDSEADFLRIMDPISGPPQVSFEGGEDFVRLCFPRMKDKISKAASYIRCDRLILAMYDNSGLELTSLPQGKGAGFHRLRDSCKEYRGAFDHVEIFGSDWLLAF